MGFITKLQAINQMLLAAGESPVADLLNSSGIDTSIAETLLEQASLDVQIRGLANNKIVRKLTPDSSGKIIFDTEDSDEEGIISAELLSKHLNKDGTSYIIAKVLNTSPPVLYNYTDETDIWKTTDTYYIEVIKKLKWEYLDTATQRSVLATAARHYQILTQGDGEADKYLQYNEQMHFFKGKASDINAKKRNIFKTGDLNVRGAILRNPYIFGYNSARYWKGSI